MADWTLSFENRNSESCVVTISGMSEAKTLSPAENPFTTQGDSKEDFFQAIRTETGYIHVIAKPHELDDLFGSAVINHKVILTVDEVVSWVGFVGQDTFSQPYAPGNQTVDIPVVSILEAAGGVYTDQINTSAARFGSWLSWFMADMNIDADITGFYFAKRTNPVTVLYKYFRPDNWPCEDGTCTKSWKEILEDICNAFGWQLQVFGTCFFFQSSDCDSGQMYFFRYSEGDTFDVREDDLTLVSRSAATLGDLGEEHNFSLYRGKGKVAVTGDPGDSDEEEVWQLDTDYFVGTSRGLDSAGSRYHYNFGNTIKDEDDNTVVTVYPSGCSSAPFWTKWINGNTYVSSPCGGGIEAYGVKEVKTVEGQGVTFSGWRWLTGLTLCPTANSGWLAIKITPNSYINTLDSSLFLKITGKIRTITEWTDVVDSESLTKKSAVLTCRVKFGSQYVQEGDQEEDTWTSVQSPIYMIADADNDASFVKFGPAFPEYETEAPYEDNDVCAKVKLPAGKYAKLEIDIFSPLTYETIIGYVITDLKISLLRDSLMYEQNMTAEKNEASEILGDGNDEEYSKSTTLTVARGAQYGTGVVFDAPLTDQEGNTEYPRAQTLDGTVTSPEDDYVSRLAAYYRTSYRVYNVALKKPVLPSGMITINSKNYQVIAQAIDWRSMDNTVTCIELK